MKLIALLLFCHPSGTCHPSLFHPVRTYSIIFALLLLPPTANSQLPSANLLHAALTTYQTQQLAATLAEFDDSAPGQWMNYVPSVGIGYNLQGQPRPTLSYSLAQIFTARRQRLAIQAKRRSIEAAHILQSQDEHRRLDQLLAKHEMMNLELQTMRKLHEIDVSLYELAMLDYEAAKLAPVAFLPKQKAFLQSELDLLRKEMEVKGLEGEILVISHMEVKK